MAVLAVGNGLGFGFDISAHFNAIELEFMDTISATSTYYAADLALLNRTTWIEFVGTGFRTDNDGLLNAGTINRMVWSNGGLAHYDIWEIAIPATQMRGWGDTLDTPGALNALFGGADRMGGSSFADRLWGLGGNDFIWGLGGDDILTGDAGNDFLRGGPGNDTILGGADHDIIAGGAGINSVNGDSGIDLLLIDGARRATSLGFTAEGSFTLGGDSFTSFRGNAVSARESTSFGGIENFAFTDGRLVFAVNDVAMQVTRIYHTATGAAPNPYGMNWWIDQLSAGTSSATMANSFAAGEFVSTFGALNDTQYITQLYQNSAGRAPTGGELSFWQTQLTNGMSRGAVMQNFAEYTETKGHIGGLYSGGVWDQDGATASIARLYQATLDRRPDEAGLAGWRAEMDNGRSLLDITPGFLNSAEFTAIYGSTTNTQFVTLLYDNVLDRAPDTAGLNGWVGQLNNGALTRSQVVLGFSESLEFQLGSMSWIEGGIIFA